MRVTPVLIVVSFLVQNVWAQASLRAQRIETPPTIDGVLAEPVWKASDFAGNFRQFEPNEGEPATERTEVRVLYDNASLYVGVRLFDSEPDKIVRRLSRRDDDPDADRFTFYVDALHDRLTGAAFEVSAAGAQRDVIISNDTNRDDSWDAVWDAAVSIDSEGWSAELRIPLSQLRFLKSDSQTWGFNVERFIYRKSERAWFQLVPKKENGLASRMADLTNIDGIAPRRALEIVPYTVARSEFLAAPRAGDPFNDGSRYSGATGFDLKYAVKPNVILNATVNPDFGQVEIDPAVVNLGAFETFFPEKRPFFIEGAQIFDNFGNLGANNRMGFDREEPLLLHTRRIGRLPQGESFGDFVDLPSGTTILGAAKLTGKTNSGWSFGFLDAVTAREYARVSTNGVETREEAEPSTNYFAGRVLKEFGGGRSGLGAIVTNVSRDFQSDALKELLPGRGTVVGIDGYQFLDSEREWVVNGRLVASEVSGTALAIERLQLAPQRYFQRTETPQVSFDPSRTRLRGWNGDINLNRNEGAWTVNAALWGVSPGFESGDLGFHFNGDIWGTHAAFNWRQINPDGFTRDRNIMVSKYWVWNYDNTVLSDGLMMFPNLTFLNYWNAGGTLGLFRGHQYDRLSRGGPPMVASENGFANVYLNTDFRKKVVLNWNANYEWSGNGDSSAGGGFSVEWKPSSRVNLSTGPSYSDSIDVAQYISTEEDPSATATHGQRYVFAPLKKRELSIDTRVNVLFTPKMSVQLYMQPLMVVGDYGDFKSLARPKSFDFDPYPNPVDSPDFNFKSLRVNAIFRWEWRLGSTIYAAWTQQRQDIANSGRFQLGRDLSQVFTGPADNVFLIKISHWLSR